MYANSVQPMKLYFNLCNPMNRFEAIKLNIKHVGHIWPGWRILDQGNWPDEEMLVESETQNENTQTVHLDLAK